MRPGLTQTPLWFFVVRREGNGFVVREVPPPR